MSTWTKLPGLPAKVKGCLNCGVSMETLDLHKIIGVGFGQASLIKDNEMVWYEKPNTPFDQLMTVQQAEDMALQDPDHDWRIEFVAPLYESEYQRQDVGQWVLVRTGLGFA